jgi:hypothetical protein
MRYLGLSIVVLLVSSCSCGERDDRDRPDGGATRPDTGGLDAPPPDVPPPDVPPACSGSVTGTVRFPNGLQPVPGALVYAPRGEMATRTGMCGQCIESGSVHAYVETEVDGSFRLGGLPLGPVTIVIEKGKFTRRIPVDVGACGAEIALEAEQSRLPRDTAEGTIPRIAIATGAFDFMQNVVAKMGLGRVDGTGTLVPGSGQFDLYDGEGFGAGDPELELLLRDRARLTAYDVVFINCGSWPEEDFPSILEDPGVRDNLRAFVEGGGRLYVTDEAYDYVEQIYPRFISFAFGAGTGLTDTPEMEDIAEIGDDLTTVRGMVHDDQLRAWLMHLGLIAADGTVAIQEMIAGWAVISRVDMERTVTWVSGEVSWTGDFKTETGVQPLTVTFDRGCGRVLYTSYHTTGFDGEGSSTLTPQELILAYLTLEIGTCIEDPILF